MTVVYIALSTAFLYIVPLASVTSATAFVAQFGTILFGVRGANILSVCVLVCVLSGLAALMTAAPRVYAMAQDGSFPAVFASLNRRGAPVTAALFQTGMALLLLSLGAFEHIIPFFIFSAVIFLGITAATTLRIDSSRSTVFAVVAFTLCCLLVSPLVLVHAVLQSLIGAAVVVAGLPLYALTRRTPIALASGAKLSATDHLI